MRNTLKSIIQAAKTKMKLIGIVTVSLIVGGIGATAALAAIPDANGIIHGCYRTGGLLPNGALRIIDSPSQTCNANETAINWNQAGPTGSGSQSGLIYFYSEPQAINANSELIANSGCGSTVYHAISGGYEAFTNPAAQFASRTYDIKLAASGPEIGTGNFVSQPNEVTPGTSENGTWTFHFKNTSPQTAYVKTYVVCMRLAAQ